MKRILATIVILAVAKGLAGMIVKKYHQAPRPRPHQGRTIHGVGGRVTNRMVLPARRAGWQRNVKRPGGVR